MVRGAKTAVFIKSTKKGKLYVVDPITVKGMYCLMLSVINTVFIMRLNN